jgi:hypothetical protein
MKVWVVTGESESSDHYGPFVLSEKPSEAKLKEICEHCDWPEGENDGPGDFGSYTYLTVTECEIDKIE